MLFLVLGFKDLPLTILIVFQKGLEWRSGIIKAPSKINSEVPIGELPFEALPLTGSTMLLLRSFPSLPMEELFKSSLAFPPKGLKELNCNCRLAF